MKTFQQSTLLIVLISFFASAFTVETFSDFTIKVEGIEDRDLMREGLALSELALMTIGTNVENMRVDAFEISLARGSRLVSPTKPVQGNSFDLTTYAELARPGDRFALKLKVIKAEEGKSPVNKQFYVTFPVK
ncbi:hypothetical protein QQ020_07530 [Fulvivirgaceae bacterium BMA12]|uniref:Uncharacterized protein n=1 Tax=Agaribacillus aureus TaxID=3051825 RepID=A0ABT8L630_9BACT|nr:hypothetical protein [Fulvivirgaceae bacterium BMA12]